MNDGLLKDELNQLQMDYRNVLMNVRHSIFKGDSAAVIDEVNIFWFKNRNLVEIIINNLGKPYETYIFTAATLLDVDGLEHYPFITLGKYHIWDDPLCNYVNIIDRADNQKFDEVIKKKIVSLIDDNLKILETASDIIFILPVRYQMKYAMDTVFRNSLEAFYNMFNDDYDDDTYLESFNEIESIEEALSPGVGESIMFDDEEDSSSNLSTRFKMYRENNTLPMAEESSDAEVFRFTIISNISQAIMIILMCLEYRLNPYIRSKVVVHNIMVASNAFTDQPEVKNIVFKCALAYLLHGLMDKEEIGDVDFRKFCICTQKLSFESKLISDLASKDISFENPHLTGMTDSIEALLQQLYHMTLTMSGKTFQ